MANDNTQYNNWLKTLSTEALLDLYTQELELYQSMANKGEMAKEYLIEKGARLPDGNLNPAWAKTLTRAQLEYLLSNQKDVELLSHLLKRN